ncbi:MAG: flagellar hook-basal body complex protein FliE [Pseudomonadota bacterium]
MIEALAGVSAIAGGNGVQLSTAAMTETAKTQGTSFAEAIQSTAAQTLEQVQQSEQMSMAAMHGQTSLQEVVQATVQAEVAVETALSIRNKLIESYQEIMRMPV